MTTNFSLSSIFVSSLYYIDVPALKTITVYNDCFEHLDSLTLSSTAYMNDK